MTASLAGAPRATRQGQPVPRAESFELLARAFRYPDIDLCADLRGALQDRLEAAIHDLGALATPAPAPVSAAPDIEALQVEYTRLFDAGPDGPLSSLNEGHHRGDRLKVMEDLLRFFDYFGLRFSPDSGLMPDHLSVELEFMAMLARAATMPDLSSALAASRDFAHRHLCSWLPALHQSVAHHAELPIYPALIELTRRFVEADLAFTSAQLRLEGQQ